MAPDVKTIDWNEVWDDQVARHRETQQGIDCAMYWESKARARQYWDSVYNGQQSRIEHLIRELDLPAESRVLDVGAGPGVLALPLAEKVAHVTAVDPSTGMMDVLHEKIAAENIDNISCVAKRWEDVDPAADLDTPYDAVVCSFAIGGMTNVRSAVEKMQQVCSNSIYIYWFAAEPSWESCSRKLAAQLHGRRYARLPKSEVLINVLYQMGILPDVRVFNYHHVDRFPCYDDALDYFRDRYNAETELHEHIIREHIDGVCEYENNELVIRSEAKCLKIWWNKNAEYPVL